MNEFQGIESGRGLLKNVYDGGSDSISEALKRLRKKRRQKGMELLAEDETGEADK